MDASESRAENLPVNARNVVIEFEMRNVEIDTWVKHTIKGSPHEIEVELLTAGSRRDIGISMTIETRPKRDQ